MGGPTDVVQPPVARAARARDACLWHVSSVGGARRCGCAATGAPVFVNQLEGLPGALATGRIAPGGLPIPPSAPFPGGAEADHAERLFALSQDLLGAADAHGYLRWVNAAWERTIGWTPAELYARPYLDFMHPDDREKVIAFALALEHTPRGESGQVEARALCKDGSFRWFRCSAAVAIEGPEPLVYLSAIDVTDLHEAVEQLAGERTRSVRRTAELERSNAELERFAGVVSHDLRQSLTAVSGFLALLESRFGAELPEGAGGLLLLARESSERMHSLVDDLLAYARVGTFGPRPGAGRHRRARPPARAHRRRRGRARDRSSCRSFSRARASSSSCWPT